MTEHGRRIPPRWLFAIITIGGFVACGIYVGLIRAGDGTTGNIVKAIAFGILGLVMLWGVLSRSDS